MTRITNADLDRVVTIRDVLDAFWPLDELGDPDYAESINALLDVARDKDVAVVRVSDIETVERAIDHLTKLKKQGTPGPWGVHERPEWHEVRGPDGSRAVSYVGGHDAELIATLHRTIDAQLAILRLATWWWEVPKLRAGAYLLAKDILGES